MHRPQRFATTVPHAVLAGPAGIRLVYGLACAACIAVGLASRRYPEWLPDFVARFAGDTLWASTLSLGLGLVWTSARPVRKAWIAVGIAFAVEASQLLRTPWLDAVRATTAGALLLGRGFLWSDLICYAAGVVLGLGFDVLLGRFRRNHAAPV